MASKIREVASDQLGSSVTIIACLMENETPAHTQNGLISGRLFCQSTSGQFGGVATTTTKRMAFQVQKHPYTLKPILKNLTLTNQLFNFHQNEFIF